MSNIEWTGITSNPLIGCDKISAGCKNCYAIRTAWIRMHNPKMAEKYAGTVEKTASGELNWTGKINFDESVLMRLLNIKRPMMIFINSMSDLFHKDVSLITIAKFYAVFLLSPHLTIQVLSKRIDRMLDVLTKEAFIEWVHAYAMEYSGKSFTYREVAESFPLKNVWHIASVEDQKQADHRIPLLLQVPTAVRGLSCEPLLGLVNLSIDTPDGELNSLTGKCIVYNFNCTYDSLSRIHWVIVGGESGPGARPMHPDWARSLRDQCAAAAVPFFFKQWGEWHPQGEKYANGLVNSWDVSFTKTGKKAAGRLLDGMEHNGYPRGTMADKEENILLR